MARKATRSSPTAAGKEPAHPGARFLERQSAGEELNRSIGRTRATTMSRGLGKIDTPQGMIVAYATQSGRTAEDGTGRNSPYTTAFLKHVEAQEEIGTVFRRVSADVYEATSRAQLAGAVAVADRRVLSQGPTAGSGGGAVCSRVLSAAAQAWAAVKDTTSVAILDAFIQQYGESTLRPVRSGAAGRAQDAPRSRWQRLSSRRDHPPSAQARAATADARRRGETVRPVRHDSGARAQ